VTASGVEESDSPLVFRTVAAICDMLNICEFDSSAVINEAVDGVPNIGLTEVRA